MASIVLQAPGPNIAFGAAPSGSTYISDANGLVVITNGSVNDELYLLGAGCIALVPGGFGGNSNQIGTLYTVQVTDLAQIIVCTNAGAFTLNLPATFPVGFYVDAIQGGAGTVTANPLGGGSTVGAHQTTQAQYLQLRCVVIANNAGLTAAVWDTIRMGA
ncbi:MAG TPA: hypothetical protein VHT03_01620 [Rhizomicrobium sp.]|jgi:hypothetical protein|nr:hypothetical protein [Rhizomicrobium sp.]